jgi:hypothetical protein
MSQWPSCWSRCTLAASVSLLTACGGSDKPTGPSASQTALSFCAPDVPTWLAYQDGDGAWTRVTPDANNVFTVSIRDRGGIAYVMPDVGLFVLYSTPATMKSVYPACGASAFGSKTLHGTFVGLAASDAGMVAVGPSSDWTTGADPSFTLTDVPNGSLDLVAARTPLADIVPTKLIVRRGLDLADGATIPAIDFNAAEALAPATAALTISGIGSDPGFVGIQYVTATATNLDLGSAFTSGSVTYGGMPAAAQASGDLHAIFAAAFPGLPASLYPLRETVLYARSVANRTVALGPIGTTATVTTVATTPYMRLRGQLAVQPEYNVAVKFEFYDVIGPRAATVMVSSDYNSGATMWDAAIPDLRSAGFDASLGLQAGEAHAWQVSVIGGATLAQFVAAHPVDGLSFRIAVGSPTNVASGAPASVIGERSADAVDGGQIVRDPRGAMHALSKSLIRRR